MTFSLCQRIQGVLHLKWIALIEIRLEVAKLKKNFGDIHLQQLVALSSQKL